MRSSWWWLGLVPLLSCQHAQTTDAEHPPVTDSASSSDAGSKPDVGSRKSKSSARKPALPDENGRIEQPGHPVLAVSAEGLRRPGGTEKLKAALHKAGVLPDPGAASEDGIEQAITRFQGQHDLARTGFADHETLRQLGLDTSDVDLSERPRTPTDGGAP